MSMGNIFAHDIFECTASRKDSPLIRKHCTSESEQICFEAIALNIETEAIRKGYMKEG